jgi:CheY-like chemotaxis protein
MSDDEKLWQGLLAAASDGEQELVRDHAADGASRALRLVKPAIVLLDLDLSSTAPWDAADLLLQDTASPPLLLLTSRSDQSDFKSAIEAGSLMDKSECPARLLQLADLALQSPFSARRERSRMQRRIIRWLKPYNWSAQAGPLHRFWGINE